jgi:hypothetical protein
MYFEHTYFPALLPVCLSLRPISDIARMQDVQFVMKSGVVYKQPEKIEVTGYIFRGRP